ncbi:MAG: glycosyltransferase family 4 protein [Treponema sp.]|nr:glycosyltransferase family 4 protein [Treponema sp.]
MRENHSRIYKIDGVGVDLSRFRPATEAERSDLRRAHGFSDDDFILLYVAEFIPRKNHKLLFDILPGLKERIPGLKVVLCGKGRLLDYYRDFASRRGMVYVTFTGYTNEVAEWCQLADVHISTSVQEGQGLNLVEAMACGLPLVASDIRGHRDVIAGFEGGILCDLSAPRSFADAVLLLEKNAALRAEISVRNVERARLFSVVSAVRCMAEIYEGMMARGHAGGGTTVE